jgi:uncharacterized membrane protein (DUF2068 family)
MSESKFMPPMRLIRNASFPLRTLAIFEATKGVLAFLAALGVLSFRHTDLRVAIDMFLQQHRINAQKHHLLIESIARATSHSVSQIAGFCFAYALIRLLEGYGLWHKKRWAEWFAVMSVGLYLPFEILHFAHRPTPFNAGIIIMNIALICYMGRLLSWKRPALG